MSLSNQRTAQILDFCRGWPLLRQDAIIAEALDRRDAQAAYDRLRALAGDARLSGDRKYRLNIERPGSVNLSEAALVTLETLDSLQQSND